MTKRTAAAAVEWLAWRLIWATHWIGWHQTYARTTSAGDEVVWCADCLRWRTPTPKRVRKR